MKTKEQFGEILKKYHFIDYENSTCKNEILGLQRCISNKFLERLTAEEEIDVRCHTNIDNLVNKLIGIAQEYYWEILTEKNLYCVFVATSVIIAREEWIPEINTFNGCYNLWCRIENVPYDLLRERLKKFGI